MGDLRKIKGYAVHQVMPAQCCTPNARVGWCDDDEIRCKYVRCRPNLCPDIAAQRRINALVEKFTTRLQLQKGFSDTSESLLGG